MLHPMCNSRSVRIATARGPCGLVRIATVRACTPVRTVGSQSRQSEGERSAKQRNREDQSEGKSKGQSKRKAKGKPTPKGKATPKAKANAKTVARAKAKSKAETSAVSPPEQPGPEALAQPGPQLYEAGNLAKLRREFIATLPGELDGPGRQAAWVQEREKYLVGMSVSERKKRRFDP